MEYINYVNCLNICNKEVISLKANRYLVAILSATTLLVVISASAFGQNIVPNKVNEAQKARELYQVNKSGQTYGKSLDPLVVPDLILAEGLDGNTGYVLSSDLVGSDPATPEEAVKLQMELEQGDKYKIIPLYDKDGITVIGQFKITNN